MNKITLKPGQKARIYCQDCLTEFDITLEPKATADTKGIESKVLDMCPFCGDDDIEEQ